MLVTQERVLMFCGGPDEMGRRGQGDLDLVGDVVECYGSAKLAPIIDTDTT